MKKVLMRIFSVPSLMIMVPAVMLTIWSNLIIYSIRPPLADNQIFFSIIGLLFYLLIINLNLNFLRISPLIIWIFIIIFLIIPLLFGDPIRGSARWIDLGFTRIQPAEFSRPLLFIVFASFLQNQVLNIKKISQLLLLVIIPFILIRIEPDLGSALLLLAGWIGMMIFAGLKWKYIIIATLIVGLLSPMLWSLLQDYQKQRIITFLNPQQDPLGSGYNVLQAQIAIGSGQVFGKGIGQGSQSQLRFLPENHTDFIFASIAEEFGFAGSIILLLLYFLLLSRILTYFNDSNQNHYYRLVICGVFTALLAQVFINIGMNLGIMPVTGVTLPLISYGGSSMLATWMTLGIIVNFSLRKPSSKLKHIH